MMTSLKLWLRGELKDAKSLYGVFPGLLGQFIMVLYLPGDEIRSDHVTRNAQAARSNEA